ncbi:hypothetical protein [Deinococcus sp.]|uniref:hypothetical protein n=1 Tax=Deinococcus sp. TaxID=47478 RepID=UPI003C7C7CCE
MTLRALTRKLVPMLALTAFTPATNAAAVWAGADLKTSGYGVRAGVALLPVPFVGALGVEGGAERAYTTDATSFSAALTLRDLNLPFTPVDAFATVGAEFSDATRFYAEAGLRGPLLGPAGWRLHVRARQDGALSGGVGVELRF